MAGDESKARPNWRHRHLQRRKPVTLEPPASARLVTADWPEFDVEVAKAELLAAGWSSNGVSTWRAPSGHLYRGPALAWKLMRKHGNRC